MAYNASVGTMTTDLTALMKVYYDKNLLYFAKPVMVAEQFADLSRDIPQHEGQTVNFTRYVPLNKITAVTGEGLNPAAVELEAVDFEKTIAKYANSVRLTDVLQLTAYDRVLDAAVELLGGNMGESINYQYRKAMATGFYPMRVDNSTTYAKTCVCDAGSAVNGVVAADELGGQADHFWVDGVITITSGQNKGFTALVTASATTTGAITFSPSLREACDTGDTFRIVNSYGISSSNVITCAAVERAVAMLKFFKAPKYDGQNYIGIISPFVHYDFKQDSAWVNAQLYKDQVDGLFTGEIGRWGGVRWVEDTEAWTEVATDGTPRATPQDVGFGVYSAAGTVNHTPIFGKHAYAGTRLEGVKDKLIIKVSGPQDTSNAVNAFSLVSWRVFFVAVPLNGIFGVNLLSGATTVA